MSFLSSRTCSVLGGIPRLCGLDDADCTILGKRTANLGRGSCRWESKIPAALMIMLFGMRVMLPVSYFQWVYGLLLHTPGCDMTDVAFPHSARQKACIKHKE